MHSRPRRSRALAPTLFCLISVALAAATRAAPAQQIIIKYATPSLVSATDLIATRSRDRADIGRRHGISLRAFRNVSTGAEVFKVDKALERGELLALIRELSATPGVEYAEEDALLQPVLIPNDTLYNQQWHYFEANGGINAPAAWDLATGSGVIVAVLDTGYRPHADLIANILPGYDFISDATNANDGGGRDSDALDPGDWHSAGECSGLGAANSSWHGTHVAGTIAAVTNNADGVAGVAFNARVLPVRVLGKCGGNISDIADAILWAAGVSVSGVPANPTPAQIINMSLGGPGACSSTLASAISQVATPLNGKVLVVASAGNSNLDAGGFNPANCVNVFTVAATGRNGGKASYSNFGAVVDIAAPGGDGFDGVLSTLNTGTTTPGVDAYVPYQGTSMAAPHVSGVAALIRSFHPTYTGYAIASILRGTARAFPASCSQCGAGIVNASAALAAVASPTYIPVINSAGAVVPAASSLYSVQVFFGNWSVRQKYGDLNVVFGALGSCAGPLVPALTGVDPGYRRIAGTCQIEALSPVYGH